MPDFEGFVIRIFSHIEFQETEKIKLFSEEIDDSQNLRYQTLVIADYDFVKISIFTVLGTKLWLKGDDDLHTDLRYSLKFTHSKAQNF